MTTIKELFQKLIGSKKGIAGDILEKSVDFVSGRETEGQNPDELIEKKGKDLEFYDVMMLDDRIKMAIQLKKTLILSVGGDFVSTSDEKKDIEMRDFAEDVFYSLDVSKHLRKKQRWWDVLDNLLDAMIYGFKVGEKVMGQFSEGRWAGKIRIQKIRFRHSMFFDFRYDKWGDLNEIEYGWRYGLNTKIRNREIDKKLLIFVWPYIKDGNFYGESDLSEVYNQWYAKYYIWRYRNKYIQGYGQSIPVVNYDVERVKRAELTEMENLLKNFQDNQHLLIPSVRDPESGDLKGKFEIEWRDASTARGTDLHEKALDQIDKQITRKLLIADKIGFSEAKFGNESFGKNQFDLLVAIIRDTHGRLEDVVNEMVQWLIDLNFGPQENYPEWKFEGVGEEIEEQLLGMLIEKGVVDKREKWIRKRVKIPELSEAERDGIEKEKEEARKRAIAAAPPSMPDRGKPPKGGKKPGQEDTAKPDEMAAKRGRPSNAARKRTLAANEAEFIGEYLAVTGQAAQDILGQVRRKKLPESKDMAELRKVRIPKTDLKKLLSQFYARTYFEGKISAIEDIEGRMKKAEEAKAAGFQRSSLAILEGEDWLSRDWLETWLGDYGDLASISAADLAYLKELRQRAFFVTGDIEQRMLKAVRTTLEEGWRSGLPTNQIVSSLEDTLSEDRKKYARTIARTNESDAYNTGRANLFGSGEVSPVIEAYLYNIIDDDDNTKYCQLHKNQWIRPADPLYPVWTPPNHFSCRSEYVPILIGESEDSGSYFYQYETRFKKFGTGVPEQYRTPAKGFGGTGK